LGYIDERVICKLFITLYQIGIKQNKNVIITGTEIHFTKLVMQNSYSIQYSKIMC